MPILGDNFRLFSDQQKQGSERGGNNNNPIDIFSMYKWHLDLRRKRIKTTVVKKAVKNRGKPDKTHKTISTMAVASMRERALTVSIQTKGVQFRSIQRQKTAIIQFHWIIFVFLTQRGGKSGLKKFHGHHGSTINGISSNGKRPCKYIG